MTKTEPLSNVDAAWLRMEDPTNLMMVSGILTFKEPINMDHLEAVLRHRLLKFERFRQRVVQPRLPLVAPFWQTDPNFQLNAHLHRVALPAPGDHAALQEMVSDLMSTPLDYSKPLWQMHVIENYGEGCAIMPRLHHCIGDGMALVFVLLSLTNLSPEAAWPKANPGKADDSKGELLGGTLGALFKQASSAVNTARSVTSKVVQESLESLVNPAHALELALKGTDNAFSAGRLALRSPDPKTIFKGELGVAKQAAWTRPLPLRDIKDIKNVTGGTVNDVLVTAVAGGLRRYMQSRRVPVDGLDFRAVVPVNLRSPEEMSELGNRFGLVFLSLPVGVADTLDRLAVVRERMNALKNSPEATVAFGILSVLGMTPDEVQNAMVKLFGAKATTVLTNVPGPPVPLYLAGSEIDSLMFWVPQSGRLGMGISIISYAGKVWLGIATDASLVPDPDTIIEGFYDEYNYLMAYVREAKAVENGRAPAADVSAAEEPGRCLATTKSGRRCRHPSRDGSSYCHVHRNKVSADA